MDIQQQKRFSVCVIGDTCIDTYHYGRSDRLSPEAPVPVFVPEKTEKIGGMAANVKNNLVALGDVVRLIEQQEKITKTRYVASTGFHHFLRVDDEPPLKPHRRYLKNINGIDAYDAIVIIDYDKGFITNDFADTIAQFTESHDVPVFVDTKKSDVSHFTGGCIIKVNEAEARCLKDVPEDAELIVTLGSGGARWRDEVYQTDSADFFDECGAGDTFTAGLVHAYLCSGSLTAAIPFANACAARAVRRRGTHVLTAQEVDELLVRYELT